MAEKWLKIPRKEIGKSTINAEEALKRQKKAK